MQATPMKLRQLRYFAKVVETGNITRAAEQLNLAQTALGIQIRNLEAALGVALLERHSRGVKPTRAGNLLYERALDILRRIDEAHQDVTALSGEKVMLRFGATPSILRLIGSDVIVAAQRDLPEATLHVVEELSFVLVDALHRGELDYVLAYDVPETPGLQRLALLEEDLLHISAPGDKPAEPDISFRKAVEGDLALASDRDVIWHLVRETAARLAIDLNVTYTVQSMQGIRTLIRHGVAESIMPYGTVTEQIEAGELVARRIVNPTIRRTLYLASPAHRRPLADERAFLSFIDHMVARLLAALGPYAHPLDRPDPGERARHG